MDACKSCSNKNDKVYIDTAYQAFLLKLRAYIKFKKPLFVKIRPIRNEFIFSFDQLKNDFISGLSDLIT